LGGGSVRDLLVLSASGADSRWTLARKVRRFEEGVHGKPSRVVHGTRIIRTVKVVGHQWYWTYEYAEREEGTEFESCYPMKKGRKEQGED
jgi:heme/copper-type cytochrome/quinol oxidase subunit 2